MMIYLEVSFCVHCGTDTVKPPIKGLPANISYPQKTVRSTRVFSHDILRDDLISIHIVIQVDAISPREEKKFLSDFRIDLPDPRTFETFPDSGSSPRYIHKLGSRYSE